MDRRLLIPEPVGLSRPRPVAYRARFLFRGRVLVSTSFDLLGISIEVSSDDSLFLDELRLVIGSGESLGSAALPGRSLRVRVNAGGPSDSGTLIVSGDDLHDPVGFLLGFESPTIPLRAIEGRENVVALADSDKPLFVFNGESASFRMVPRWRRILANFLLLRVLRLRPELLFFHAASVGIGEHGVMLVGPKGTGKSTLALALAARGHAFLGDEMAVLNPADLTLLPFRRPVGIKPGPHSKAVDAALARLTASVDEEGMLRVAIDDLLVVSKPLPIPLRSLLFLEGFGDLAMRRIDAGRPELSSMQPIATSLQAGTKLSHVFEMIRLLSRCRCYRLTAGDPDTTAGVIEQELREFQEWAVVDDRTVSV